MAKTSKWTMGTRRSTPRTMVRRRYMHATVGPVVRAGNALRWWRNRFNTNLVLAIRQRAWSKSINKAFLKLITEQEKMSRLTLYWALYRRTMSMFSTRKVQRLWQQWCKHKGFFLIPSYLYSLLTLGRAFRGCIVALSSSTLIPLVENIGVVWTCSISAALAWIGYV